VGIAPAAPHIALMKMEQDCPDTAGHLVDTHFVAPDTPAHKADRLWPVAVMQVVDSTDWVVPVVDSTGSVVAMADSTDWVVDNYYRSQRTH